MNITRNFLVNGLPFADWFNRSLKLTDSKIFPNYIQSVNFDRVFSDIENLTGKTEISLQEFCGHVAIIYNETGGTFTAIREYGGPAYCFNTVMPGGGTKYSYNQYPNRLAGNQLREWGVITRPDHIKLWNGQVYPYDAPTEVRQVANHCDFYKFRGWGFNQLTWRNSYETCLEPLLPKKIEDYTPEEFEFLLKDAKLAAGAFRNYVNLNRSSQYAIEQMSEGNFEPYGNLVSGGWIWYVKNKYLPRCLTLYYALAQAHLQELEKYSIDGLGLTVQDIKHLQDIILHYGNKEARKILLDNGGADGMWGPSTESAFRLLGISIEKLMQMSYTSEVDFDDLTMKQIKHIQTALMYSGNESVANLIRNSGGADGYLGENTYKALKILGKPLAKLLQPLPKDIDPEDLSRKQIIHIQKLILKSKNQRAIQLVTDAGGVDGYFGVSTVRALQILNLRALDALKMAV